MHAHAHSESRGAPRAADIPVYIYIASALGTVHVCNVADNKVNMNSYITTTLKAVRRSRPEVSSSIRPDDMHRCTAIYLYACVYDCMYVIMCARACSLVQRMIDSVTHSVQMV